MAELHVQRKRNHNLWLWFVIAVIIIAGALYYYINYYQKKNQTGTAKAGTAMVTNASNNSYLFKIKNSDYVS
jgi:hypothetical protein